MKDNQEKKPDWENQFDRLVPQEIDLLFSKWGGDRKWKTPCSRQAIVNLIRQLLSDQRQETIQKIEEALPKEKEEPKECKHEDCTTCPYCWGFNDCLKETREAITRLKK